LKLSSLLRTVSIFQLIHQAALKAIILQIAFASESFWTHEQGKGADIFNHEVFALPDEYAEQTKMPIQHAKNAPAQYTSPAELGLVFDLAKSGGGS
jgi:hypothetical protein